MPVKKLSYEEKLKIFQDIMGHPYGGYKAPRPALAEADSLAASKGRFHGGLALSQPDSSRLTAAGILNKPSPTDWVKRRKAVTDSLYLRALGGDKKTQRVYERGQRLSKEPTTELDSLTQEQKTRDIKEVIEHERAHPEATRTARIEKKYPKKGKKSKEEIQKNIESLEDTRAHYMEKLLSFMTPQEYEAYSTEPTTDKPNPSYNKIPPRLKNYFGIKKIDEKIDKYYEKLKGMFVPTEEDALEELRLRGLVQ